MLRASNLILIAGLLGSTAYAGTVTLDTNPADFNDSVTWGQLGGDPTTLSSTFSATSADSNTVTGSFSGTTGQVVNVGTDWGPASGAMSTGDAVVWAFDNNASSGTGPITLNFPTGYGAGAAIQSDQTGQFTAKIELFGSSGSLGSEILQSDVAGHALFIGAVDNVAEVVKAVLSLTAAPNGSTSDFAIDTLYLQTPASGAPEPGSALLLGGGLAFLSLKLRRRFGRP